MTTDHIHTPDDGRGVRDVYVDGKRIDHVFYADTRKGLVWAYRHPLKIDERLQELERYEIRGNVVIEKRD